MEIERDDWSAAAQFGQDKKGFFNEYIDERWDDFLSEFRNEAEEDGDLLILYRCIAVKDPRRTMKLLEQGKKTHKEKGLGIYWSWNKEAADCHWALHAGRAEYMYLVGLTDAQAVDIEGTVVANFVPGRGAEEKEIRLKEGSRVDVLGVVWRKEEYEFIPALIRQA